MNYNQKLAMHWAQKMRMLDANVADTESCGGRKEDEIISLGICKVTNGEPLFYSLIRPSSKVKFNYFATKVHGIKEKDLWDAPQIGEVWETVTPLLAEKIVIAYAKSADERMIRQTTDNHGLVLPEITWACAMQWYKLYTGQKNVTLTKACQQMNVKAGGHNALEDAIATARVIYRMANGYGT